LRLSANFLGGGTLFNKVFTAADLPGDGSYGQLRYSFLNTNVDRWRTPLVLSAVSSGRSPVWAETLKLTPQPFYATILPALCLTLLAGSAWALARWIDSGAGRESFVALPAALAPGRWSLAVLLLLTTAGYLIYQKNQSGYTYEANGLSHFVGRPVGDSAARDGRAWLVDPAVDPPQKAIYGPFDFYEAALYQVTFRLKLAGPVETEQELARLQVNATANFETLVSQPLRLEHFARPDLYHEFVLTVNNPRRQALSFEVLYTGLAPLVIDEIRIEPQAQN
jgi:hypothetical protein